MAVASDKKLLVRRGFDSLIIKSRYSQETTVVAYRPEQIKSLHNSGAFDPSSPSLSDAAPADQSAVYYHGTDSETPFDAPCIYLTPEVHVAASYGETIHAVRVRPHRILDLTDMVAAARLIATLTPDVDLEGGLGELNVMIWFRYTEDAVREWAVEQGYDAVRLATTVSMGEMIMADQPALVVFSGSQIETVDVVSRNDLAERPEVSGVYDYD